MNTADRFPMGSLDYFAFGLYFVLLCIIGWWAGRKEKEKSEDYFLAGRQLPWYVIGTSYIAANISTEHFIGMVAAAYVYGICIAQWEWGNIMAFSILIWLFIPFLLTARVFTAPEFMERRFNHYLRTFFAIVTVVNSVVASLAAVLYGGGVALNALFGWNLYVSIVVLGVVAGAWAAWGGLSSVAWTDFFTMIVMLAGAACVPILGLYMLSGDAHSLSVGFNVMMEANHAKTGTWAQAVAQTAPHIVGKDTYDRMAIFQPASHEVAPWPSIVFGFLSISIWYNAINQFMIQRVFAAKNMYHARMGIVLAGYIKIIMPLLVVVPGLILFAKKPELMLLPWDEIRPEADRGYISLLHGLIPVGLRGVLLAALFGSIQAHVNATLNSTSTVLTLDIYKRIINKNAPDKHYVNFGICATVVFLAISIGLGCVINKLGSGLFVYIQEMYAFFAPPFAAVFLLGILFKRINSIGASVAVTAGFALGILMKLYVEFVPGHWNLIEPFGNQAVFNWLFCVVVCIAVSLMTAPPKPEQTGDDMTVNWQKLNIFTNLGDHWYSSVVVWWGGFAVIVVALIVRFSGLFS